MLLFLGQADAFSTKIEQQLTICVCCFKLSTAIVNEEKYRACGHVHHDDDGDHDHDHEHDFGCGCHCDHDWHDLPSYLHH